MPNFDLAEPEPQTPAGSEYSNEWVRFLDRLVDSNVNGELIAFIKQAKLSPRAKAKLRVYVMAFLNAEFAVSNLRGKSDFDRIMSEKSLVESELYDGLLRLDITPEFQMILNLVRSEFTPRLFRSRDGWQGSNLNTQRQEILTVDSIRGREESEHRATMGERVRRLWGGR